MCSPSPDTTSGAAETSAVRTSAVVAAVVGAVTASSTRKAPLAYMPCDVLIACIKRSSLACRNVSISVVRGKSRRRFTETTIPAALNSRSDCALVAWTAKKQRAIPDNAGSVFSCMHHQCKSYIPLHRRSPVYRVHSSVDVDAVGRSNSSAPMSEDGPASVSCSASAFACSFSPSPAAYLRTSETARSTTYYPSASLLCCFYASCDCLWALCKKPLAARSVSSWAISPSSC